jgi:hypothetical protein
MAPPPKEVEPAPLTNNEPSDKELDTGRSGNIDTRCSYKKCPGGNINECQLCVGPGCSKMIHMPCFKTIHSKPSWLDKDDDIGDGVVCTRTCLKKYQAYMKRKPNWLNDGADGPDDLMCSETILLDWLTTEGNYSMKWRGKDAKGKNKKQIASEIADLMNAAKVRVKRDGKQVMNKIAHIEKAFRAAHDFANSETGQGLKETDAGQFDDAVKKKCQYYFDLLDIFGDRASAKPKATSHDNLDSSDEDEDADDDIFSVELEGFVSEIDDEHQDSTGNNIEKGNPVSTASMASKRKPSSNVSVAKQNNKKNKTITLFDDTTTDSLAALAESQRRLSQAKLQSLEKTDEEKDLSLRMKKFETLQTIRERNPALTKAQIVAMFPSLADFASIVMDDE